MLLAEIRRGRMSIVRLGWVKMSCLRALGTSVGYNKGDLIKV